MRAQDIEFILRSIGLFDAYQYKADLTKLRDYHTNAEISNIQTQAVEFYGICRQAARDIRDFLNEGGYSVGGCSHEEDVMPGLAKIPIYRLRYEAIMPGNMTIEVTIIPQYCLSEDVRATIGWLPVFDVQIVRPGLSRWEKLVELDERPLVSQPVDYPTRWSKIELE